MTIVSMPCRQAHLYSSWYRHWADVLGYPPPDRPAHAMRKWWEFAVIAQALDERGMLITGRKGLGFAVGREPLASLFASRGVQVLATDLAPNLVDNQWSDSGQHARTVDDIWAGEKICSKALFDRLVSFQSLDMNNLVHGEKDYDFLWSSCALEHLGSLGAGFEYILGSLDFLRPGGVAVHTTEYNVGSNSETIETGGAVIYRRRDIEHLERMLRAKRCAMIWPEFDPGSGPFDLDFDEPPYFDAEKPHLKLLQDGFICTSFVIVIQKVGSASEP